MPWSYVVNTSRYYSHINKKNKKQILLPDATIKNDEKSVAVLVIGEDQEFMISRGLRQGGEQVADVNF